jgi:putative ATP-dependent endonuclease of OLD family
VDSWGGAAPDQKEFMRIVTNAGGKGRYAQRLAQLDIAPSRHVEDALRYLVAR